MATLRKAFNTNQSVLLGKSAQPLGHPCPLQTWTIFKVGKFVNKYHWEFFYLNVKFKSKILGWGIFYQSA
jgi:hypothetical protein